MTKKKTAKAAPVTTSVDDPMFQSIVNVFAGDPLIGTAKMFGAPGLKVGDKFFGMLYKGHIVLKLPKDHVETLVVAGHGEYFDSGHGRLMKEWVALNPDAELDWVQLATEARDFVKTGKSK
jgi:hypothetical protein